MLITPEKFNEINQEFLESLIKNGIEENLHLDYKEKVVHNNAEVAKDISSFANRDGGNIIYGIKEEDHKPKEIIPINEKDIRERIDQISKNGIDPPLEVRILPVDVNINSTKGQVFIVYIPRKYPILHQAKKKKRYYIRTEFTSTPMSNSEIKLAFNLSYRLDQKLEDYRMERLSKIIEGKAQLNVANLTRIVLQMIPINSLTQSLNIPLDSYSDILQRYIFPIQRYGYKKWRMNLDGFIHWYEDEKTNPHSYVQLYRNGIIEAVDCYLINPTEKKNGPDYILNITYIEKVLINVIQKYFKALKALNVQLPIYVFLSFISVKNYYIPLEFQFKLIKTKSDLIDRENVMLPSIKIEHYDIEIDRALKPCFDALWNACGQPYSLNYDENGKYKSD